MTDGDDRQLREVTIESNEVFSGKLLHLRVDDVELPDGTRSKREIVVHRGAVAAVALNNASEVLLVRQWRHPAGEALLEIPAGTCEEGEEAEETLRRELAEEISCRADRIEHLADLYVAPGYSTELFRLYLATELASACGEADADENIEIVTLPLEEALEMCRDGRLRDGKTVSGLLLAAQRLGVQ